MKKTTFIYLIKLLDNKVYIGKTINIKHRESAHRKTFGSIIKLNGSIMFIKLKRIYWIIFIMFP